MPGGMGEMDYCSPCKTKTGARAVFGGEESFLPKLGGKFGG